MGDGVLADVVVLAPSSFQPDRTTTYERTREAQARPVGDALERHGPGGSDPTQSLVQASQDGIYSFRHEPFAGDAEFFNGDERSACPKCRSSEISRSGHDRNGVQRYLYADCGKAFTPMTGTVFENHRLPVTAWADFVLQALSFESVAAMTREDRSAITTPLSKCQAVFPSRGKHFYFHLGKMIYPSRGKHFCLVDGKQFSPGR